MIVIMFSFPLKGGMSQSACANLTLCQVHYVCLREDMVHIVYTPLEASAVVIREMRGCTPVSVRQYLQQFRTVLQGLLLHTLYAE